MTEVHDFVYDFVEAMQPEEPTFNCMDDLTVNMYLELNSYMKPEDHSNLFSTGDISPTVLSLVGKKFRPILCVFEGIKKVTKRIKEIAVEYINAWPDGLLEMALAKIYCRKIQNGTLDIG